MTAPTCLRCDRPLDRLEAADELQFWRCAHCQRDYAERAGRLTDRWLSPISIVLYGIIFSNRPQDDAERVVGQLTHLADDERARIAAEIRGELAHPKQRGRCPRVPRRRPARAIQQQRLAFHATR